MSADRFRRAKFVLGLATISHFALHPSQLRAAEPFPAELFPQLAGKSAEEVKLVGIAALCPGRVLFSEPKPVSPPVPESRKTRTAELPRGGAYVRLYSLDAQAVRERVGNLDGLVVDCRYLQTSAADLPAVAEFAVTLGGAPGWRPVGDFPALPDTPANPGSVRRPVLVLVNGCTTGPLEVALASLAGKGLITLVGARTAGETGVYKPLANRPGVWVLSGELLTDSGLSLTGVGITPKFPVKTSPEDEFAAWQVVERGSPLGAVLPRESSGKTETAKNRSEAAANGAAKPADKSAELTDVALARAQEVLSALRVLGGE